MSFTLILESAGFCDTQLHTKVGELVFRMFRPQTSQVKNRRNIRKGLQMSHDSFHLQKQVGWESRSTEYHPCMTMRTRRRAGDGEIARLPWGSDVLRAAAGVQLGFLNLTRFLPSNGALSNRNRQDYGKGKAL